MRIPVNAGQVALEWRHLMRKLARRSPAQHRERRVIARPQVHPLMRRRRGGVEAWERAGGPGRAR